MRRLRSALSVLAAAATLLLAPPALAHSMSEEIDHLLNFIAASPCALIRNGVSYDGEAAVAHIKDKYDYYRNDIHSAEDFIALAASKSAMSGKPYLVQCNTSTVPAADWLKTELAAFRRQP
ncbi:MAG TPA: DUF5329 domain-containing protein [Dongiaceae bacterium]|jgi:hypothetical protein|nr:DUF5329 domain-containing protein [Dongiaceae bacterium]